MDHRSNFREFSKLHILAGCPDTHVQIVSANMRKEEDPIQKVWMAGCFIGPYEPCTGSAIWDRWNISEVRSRPEEFSKWIKENWSKFNIRRERRAARTPDKMAESLLSYANFSVEVLPYIKDQPYEVLWSAGMDNLHYFGRYALIKLLETLHQGGAVRAAIPDIRPVEGWSLRQTLALLFPQHAGLMNSTDNSPHTLNLIQEYVEEIRCWLAKDLGREVTHFVVEVLLCNYRQFPKHFPGWGQDEDLMYYNEFKKKWNTEPFFDFKGIRKELFPPEVLGEVQGWEGIREDVQECFVKHDYYWSDVVWDYNQSKRNLAKPVKR